MHVNYVEQGCCGECGSENVEPTDLIGGRPGENILAFFVCNDCGCQYIEVYTYSCKGVIPENDGRRS